MHKNISLYEKNKKYQSVSSFLQAVSEYGKKIEENISKNNKGRSISLWFRGQEVDDWEIVPGVYRDGFAQNETKRLYKERHMAQDFRIEIAGILDGDKTDSELYFLKQHYEMPTRLVDWSTNALAALFFAVSGSNNNSHADNDAAVYMMNAYDTAPTQSLENTKYKIENGETIKFEGIATSRNRILSTSLKRIYRWRDDIEFPDFVMPVRPDQFDSRIKLQSGCFTFHVPGREKFTNKENRTLRQFIIDKNNKEEIFKDLLLLGIDEFSIYGDLTNLSKKLKRLYYK